MLADAFQVLRGSKTYTLAASFRPPRLHSAPVSLLPSTTTTSVEGSRARGEVCGTHIGCTMVPHIVLSSGMSFPRSLLQPTRELGDTKSFLYNARVQLQVVHRSKRPQVASLISADLISITHPRFSPMYRNMQTKWRTLTLLGRPLNVQPHCCVVDGAML